VSVRIPRRQFLSTLAGVTGAALVPGLNASSSKPGSDLSASPFRIAVINDEITQDFGRACEIAARDFGMRWIELRGMWNKNIVNLEPSEITEAQRILQKYQLQVTDIASPLFKADWPGAPKSKFSPQKPQFGADFSFDQQGEVLARSIEMAKAFRTDRVRCFDFWRLDNVAPYRDAMNSKLRDAAAEAGKHGITLCSKMSRVATPQPAPKLRRCWRRFNLQASCLIGILRTRLLPARSLIPTDTRCCRRNASGIATARTR